MRRWSENFFLPVDASDVPFYRSEIVADVVLKNFFKILG